MFNPDEHQLSGARWLASRQRGYLADDMGLGKTITALLAFRETRQPKLLVTCPASVVNHWTKEAATVLPGARVAQLSGTEPIDPDTQVLVSSYQMLANNRLRVLAYDAPVQIYDEAHYLKTSTTKRTEAARQIAARAPFVWGLSGTPMPNDPTELWSQCVICAPGALGNPPMTEAMWAHTYCTGYQSNWGFKPTGFKNLDRFRDEVVGRHFLRRTLQEVGLTLPERVTRFLHVHPAEDGPQSAADRRAIKHAPPVPALATVAAMFGAAGDAPNNSSAARHWGTLKARLVAPSIVQALASGSVDKVVVGAVHHDALDVLQHALGPYGLVRLDGAVPTAKRGVLVDRFQNDQTCRVFLGQIDACAEGITLTAANVCYQVELADRGSTNVQFAKRLHRRGQQRGVLHFLVTMREGPDVDATKRLKAKLDMMQKADFA